MISERERADRRVAIRALAASAVAVVVMVSLTSGVPTEPAGDAPQNLSFVAE